MFGFRRKKGAGKTPSAAPPVLTARTVAFKARFVDVMRIKDPAARYMASLHLQDSIDQCLKDMQSAFDDKENKRMAGTLAGISMGIPLGAIGAAALGTPYLLLIIVPAAMGTGIYASHKHQKELEAFQAEIAANLSTLDDIRKHLTQDRDRIAAQYLPLLAASPHRPFLERDCPKLRKAFRQAAPSQNVDNRNKHTFGSTLPKPPRP